MTHLAAKAQLPSALVIDTARKTVDLFYQYWRSEQRNLPLTKREIKAIEAHVARVPLVSQTR